MMADELANSANPQQASRITRKTRSFVAEPRQSAGIMVVRLGEDEKTQAKEALQSNPDTEIAVESARHGNQHRPDGIGAFLNYADIDNQNPIDRDARTPN